MSLKYDKRTYEGLKLASSIVADQERQAAQRESLLNLIRIYAPEDVTEGVADDVLLQQPEMIKTAMQGIRNLENYEFSEKRDEVIGSLPVKSLENLVLQIPPVKTGDERHDRAYALQKKMIEASQAIQELEDGEEAAVKRVKEYASKQGANSREKLEAYLKSDRFSYLSDDTREALLKVVPQIVESSNSDPKVVVRAYRNEFAKAQKEFKELFGEEYTISRYVAENLKGALDEIGADGKDTKASRAAKEYINLIRFEGVDSPEKLQEYFKKAA